LPVAATLSRFGVVSDILSLFVNGSEALAVVGRDTDATWRSLGTLCRERDWSRPRLIYELQNGLRHRTVPPGHTIDWHDPTAVSSLDVEASTVMILGEVLDMAVGFDSRIVGVEVLPPMDAEVPATASASAQWAAAATRHLRADSRIPERATKAELARLLEAEARTAARAGQLDRALKASYLENQLTAWGIWPLSSFK
jgi:hypothetical protein